MSRGEGTFVTSPALTEKPELLASGLTLAAQVAHTSRQAYIALTGQFTALAARNAMQFEGMFVETLTHPRDLKVRESTERVETQATTRRSQVLSSERLDGLGAAKRVRRAGWDHPFLA
jgi:hypothetical protein